MVTGVPSSILTGLWVSLGLASAGDMLVVEVVGVVGGFVGGLLVGVGGVWNDVLLDREPAVV